MAIISDSLRQSHRFAAIDHEQYASIDGELAHIQPGSAPPAEIAKPGHANPDPGAGDADG